MPLQLGWSRINVFLPVNNVEERRAADRSINLLRSNYEGSTHSAPRPPVFVGYWRDPDSGDEFEDFITIVSVDIPKAMSSVDLDVEVDIIKLCINSNYSDETGFPQADIWLTAQEVFLASKV